MPATCAEPKPKPTAEELLRRAAAHALQYGCLLCRGARPGAWIVQYIPEGQEDAEVRHDRRVIYALCDGCHDDPEFPAKAESRVAAELRRMRP